MRRGNRSARPSAARLLRGASPTRGWRQELPGRRSAEPGGGERGPGSHPSEFGVEIAASAGCTRHRAERFDALSLILPRLFKDEEDGAERLCNLLKVTQPGFKATIFVNPNPVSFVWVSLPDGEVAGDRGDNWTRKGKEADPFWEHVSPGRGGGRLSRPEGLDSIPAQPLNPAKPVGGK